MCVCGPLGCPVPVKARKQHQKSDDVTVKENWLFFPQAGAQFPPPTRWPPMSSATHTRAPNVLKLQVHEIQCSLGKRKKDSFGEDGCPACEYVCVPSACLIPGRPRGASFPQFLTCFPCFVYVLLGTGYKALCTLGRHLTASAFP